MFYSVYVIILHRFLNVQIWDSCNSLKEKKETSQTEIIELINWKCLKNNNNNIPNALFQMVFNEPN